jgi:hypothetical protein
MVQVRRQMTEELSRHFGLSFEALDLETAKALFEGGHT